jgi:hypothetical protein
VVRARVEHALDALTARCAAGEIASWLHAKVAYLVTVLRRLGDGLYHCYDVPGLPRTDNAMEQFYRRVKSEQRRITGRKRADAFVVRVGGAAVYATAASAIPEATLLTQLGAVPAEHQRSSGSRPAPPCGRTKTGRPRCAASAAAATPTSLPSKPAGPLSASHPDATSTATVFPQSRQKQHHQRSQRAAGRSGSEGALLLRGDLPLACSVS